MATRLEARLGVATEIGTAYVLVATATTKTNTAIQVTNVTSENGSAATSNLRLYIADTTWSSGRPTGSTLIARLAGDTPMGIGDILFLTGNILNSGDKIVARASVATSLDVIVNTVEIT